MRTKNDLTEPRIAMTINSFRRHVADWQDLNCLLLDCNSTDGSEKLLSSYTADKWKFVQKRREDYYLGTLCRLLNQYQSRYEFIMVVDNDQYFLRSGFLETALTVLRNPKYINFQLNEPTVADFIDHKKKNTVAGVFDGIGNVNGDIYLRAAKFKGTEKCYKSASRAQGSGMVHVKGKVPKRVCWLWFGASNTILRMDPVRTIFDRKECKPPYKRNAERLALFASYVGKLGRTGHLAHGASINVGHRKHLPKNYNLKDLIHRYEHGHKGLFRDDHYSYMLRKGNLQSIEEAIKARGNSRD